MGYNHLGGGRGLKQPAMRREQEACVRRLGCTCVFAPQCVPFGSPRALPTDRNINPCLSRCCWGSRYKGAHHTIQDVCGAFSSLGQRPAASGSRRNRTGRAPEHRPPPTLSRTPQSFRDIPELYTHVPAARGGHRVGSKQHSRCSLENPAWPPKHTAFSEQVFGTVLSQSPKCASGDSTVLS